jgi:hypothetical protein
VPGSRRTRSCRPHPVTSRVPVASHGLCVSQDQLVTPLILSTRYNDSACAKRIVIWSLRIGAAIEDQTTTVEWAHDVYTVDCVVGRYQTLLSSCALFSSHSACQRQKAAITALACPNANCQPSFIRSINHTITV